MTCAESRLSDIEGIATVALSTASAAESPRRAKAIRKSKIMIIDEESSTVKTAEEVLRREGYTNVVATTNCRDALALVAKERPDLLVVDAMAPRGGLDVQAALRADTGFAHLPIVMLTRPDDESIRQEARGLGACDFLNKPISSTELISRVWNALTVKQHSDRVRTLQSSKIMIVDDEPVNVKLLEKYLKLEGYSKFVSANDSRQALALVAQEEPDVLLLDIMMPHVSGLEILAALRADERFWQLPVVILTAATDQRTKRQALELGASDFLTKPIDPTELLPRLWNVLTVKKHFDHMERYAVELETDVSRRTAELARSRREVIYCLARAAEFRDNDTGRHVVRVGRYARLIAEELGWRGEGLDMLEQAAQLHDIGKIGIADSILRKPGKLSAEEFELIRRHTSFGKEIAECLPDDEAQQLRGHAELGLRLLESTESPVLALAAKICMTHHERWDGTGYPRGLAGEEIPIEGRITAVADVFDALSSRRPYKPAYPLDECLRILEEGRGTHFDPQVLDAFMSRRAEIFRARIEYGDDE